MVRCQKIIEIMEEENTLENTKQIGNRLLNSFIQFEKEFSEITNARGRGMFLAFDLPDTETRNKAMKAFNDHDMLTLSSGHRSIRIRPALNMNEIEADEFVRRMKITFVDMFKAK